MKKILFMLFGLLLVSPVFATQGNVSIVLQGPKSVSGDATFSFSGAVSSTGAVDNSAAIYAKGYAGIQFKVVKATYRGTYKIQGSNDNSNWTDIFQSSNDAAAVTETFYWQNFSGWDYYRVSGDPNASNAGTATTTGKLIGPDNKSVPKYTGFYGPHTECQELLASAARTADVNGYFYSQGPGVELLLNTTAIAAGSVTLQIFEVSPTGVATFKQQTTAVTAVSTTVGNRTLIISPSSAPVTNTNVTTTVEPGGGSQRYYYVIDFSATDSTTFSLTACPLPYGNPIYSAR